MGVPRYTTPTFTLTFTEHTLDLTQASEVFVTFKQASFLLTKTGEDLVVAEKTIGVYMTQEETGSFCVGDVDIQANWVSAGKRIASEIVSFNFTQQLLQRVI